MCLGLVAELAAGFGSAPAVWKSSEACLAYLDDLVSRTAVELAIFPFPFPFGLCVNLVLSLFSRCATGLSNHLSAKATRAYPSSFLSSNNSFAGLNRTWLHSVHRLLILTARHLPVYHDPEQMVI